MQDFSINAYWKGRPEEPVQIAARLRTLLASLRPIAPEFRRWYQVISEDSMPETDGTEAWLAEAVAARVHLDELDEPVPYLGYFVVTSNEPRVFSDREGDVAILASIGSNMVNSASVRSGNARDLPISLQSYPVVQQTLLALSTAFKPLWSEAGPFCLWEGMDRSCYKEGPVITPCWMIHLSPSLAGRITPPSEVTVKRFADGSLFLAVTEQTFDPQNAEHVAAAFRLFAVLDPLQEKKPPEQWRR